jgi:hypothetical protein
MSDKDLPIRLLEDDTGDRFLLYSGKDGIEVDLRFEAEQPWFTESQLASIFGVDKNTVNGHIQQFVSNGEIREATTRKFRVVRQEGGREVRREITHYGLDVAFYVGYRVNSDQGVFFRRWATGILITYATKGFVIDSDKLKNPDGKPDYFDELLAKIRDIRSSEKRMWTRTLELASVCSDYDSGNPSQHEEFFAGIQNAMHWAVTQHTAAEIVHTRVDHTKPYAGLTHFKGREPTLEEAKVAKNYLAEAEITALNHITSLTLEFFESQAEQRKSVTLRQFLTKMRDLISLDGRPLIAASSRGRVSAKDAHLKATAELYAYKSRRRLDNEQTGDKELRQILKSAKPKISPKKV